MSDDRWYEPEELTPVTAGRSWRLWPPPGARTPPAAPVRTRARSRSQAHDWSYDRAGFPLYCTHCTFMNELMPIRWYGMPMYPSEPPGDYDRDPCTWYWYKDPADIPDEHWERYGLQRGAV